MRRLAPVLCLLLAACVGQELAPTTTVRNDSSTTDRTSATTTPISPTTSQPLTSTTTTKAPSPLTGLAYETIFEIDFPIHMTARPGSELSYVATKEGRVWAFDGQRLADIPVLDIRDTVRNQGEQGLLAIALHPSDEDRFYAHYSANDGDTVVAEFRFTDPLTIDRTSERVLLRLDQPAGNHNGGMILFHPDGRLLVGLGDGGGAGDQFGNGQNTGTLLAGLVAIDIEGDPRPTLTSYGLRNPWRFWIDSGLIYIADVGQGSYEEVSVAPLGEDLNYGWPVTEGLHCYQPSSGCESNGIKLPILEIAHGDAGTCSITGGLVYRGAMIPELQGTYFYSDYCGGYLRSFRFEDSLISEQDDWTEQVGTVGRVSSFGIDGLGEMYVLTTEKVVRLIPLREGS